MSVTSYLMNYVNMQHGYVDIADAVSMQLNNVDILHVNIRKSHVNIPVSIQNVDMNKLLVIISIMHANIVISYLAYKHIQVVFTRFIMHVGASK